jgi:NAD(P)-dependent dehydrogenase (short-subunit alcohol dehydrogenase family)
MGLVLQSLRKRTLRTRRYQSYEWTQIVQEREKLPGTIHTAAEDIRKAGGEALPIVCDVRSEEQVQQAIDKTVEV